MERAVAGLGIACMVAVAWLASTQRRAVDWRSVGISFVLQLAIAFLFLRTGAGLLLFGALNDAAVAFIAAADHGIDFVFGRWPARVMGESGEAIALPYVFAIRVLPVIIFMSSVFSVLYHFGVLQRIVQVLSRGLRRVLPLSGAEALSTVANIFLGMTEAPLMVRPYIESMTRSELFLVMVAGLASVAGSVLVAYMGMVGPEYAGHLIAASFMSAPAAIMYSKLMIPEAGIPRTGGEGHLPAVPRTSVNAIDAAADGAAEGLRLALNIAAMLIAFVALIYLLDSLLALLCTLVGLAPISFAKLLGYVLAPVAWLLGVPSVDALRIGEMLGIKTVLNEFISYQMLAEARSTLAPRSVVIASYAMCGFANFGSLAILLGGLGGMAPGRRADIARDGLRAILAGSLASFTTGAIAGMLL
jgi:concentrative nucleoside transporter, CNT family